MGAAREAVNMTTNAGSVRQNSVLISNCFQELFRRIKATSNEDDPAPWHKVFVHRSEEDPSAFIRQQKLQDRTERAMQTDFLSGSLRVHYSDELEACDVPGWACEGAETNDNVWSAGRLELSVFLPDLWQRWSGEHVFLDLDAFEHWLDYQDLADTTALSELPAPYDAASKPDLVNARLPPNVPFVTFSQTLSWIAFHFGLDQMSLDREMKAGAFGSINFQEQALADAVAKFAAQASGSNITARGRYVEVVSSDRAMTNTKQIEQVHFEDYAQFDILVDGLRFGKGLT
jgi:hypothetical protein